MISRFVRLPVLRRSQRILSTINYREKLTDKEYRILREKGTEPPFTGKYDAFYPKKGYFACKACDNPLFTWQSKFKSGCGWPAFDKFIKGSITTKTDTTFNMIRVEIMCSKCGSHQGHVFHGEEFTETNERHCVNSLALNYVEKDLENIEEETCKE